MCIAHSLVLATALFPTHFMTCASISLLWPAAWPCLCMLLAQPTKHALFMRAACTACGCACRAVSHHQAARDAQDHQHPRHTQPHGTRWGRTMMLGRACCAVVQLSPQELLPAAAVRGRHSMLCYRELAMMSFKRNPDGLNTFPLHAA
jgi:hypothetical protein